MPCRSRTAARITATAGCARRNGSPNTMPAAPCSRASAARCPMRRRPRPTAASPTRISCGTAASCSRWRKATSRREMMPGTLETRGYVDLGGAASGPFTAHPKLDPVTGEMVFFGYGAKGPLSAGMSYGTLDASGRVARFDFERSTRPIPRWCMISSSPTGMCCSRSCRSPAAWIARCAASRPTPGSRRKALMSAS